MSNRLFKISEVAKLLNIHPDTIRGWIRDGKLSIVRVGQKMIRVPFSEIERLQELQTGTNIKEQPQKEEGDKNGSATN